MPTPETVDTRENDRETAWAQEALERRYFRVTLGAVRCRLCGAFYGLACAPALTAQHLAVVHHITTLEED